MSDSEREIGRVKNYFDGKGFGFIRRSDGSDLFVHVSATGMLPLKAGEKVSFEVGMNPRSNKIEAKRVSIID
jgi:cold shock CspA family protein